MSRHIGLTRIRPASPFYLRDKPIMGKICCLMLVMCPNILWAGFIPISSTHVLDVPEDSRGEYRLLLDLTGNRRRFECKMQNVELVFARGNELIFQDENSEKIQLPFSSGVSANDVPENVKDFGERNRHLFEDAGDTDKSIVNRWYLVAFPVAIYLGFIRGSRAAPVAGVLGCMAMFISNSLLEDISPASFLGVLGAGVFCYWLCWIVGQIRER